MYMISVAFEGARCVIDIIVGNRVNDPSSNLGRGFLRFT